MITRCGADLYPGSCQRRTKPGQECWQHAWQYDENGRHIIVTNRSRERRMMQQHYYARVELARRS